MRNTKTLQTLWEIRKSTRKRRRFCGADIEGQRQKIRAVGAASMRLHTQRPNNYGCPGSTASIMDRQCKAPSWRDGLSNAPGILDQACHDWIVAKYAQKAH